MGVDDPACLAGQLSWIRYPIYLESYPVLAIRKAYDLFDEGLKREPRFDSSFVILEGYSVQGVQEKVESESAFAWRADRILA